MSVSGLLLPILLGIAGLAAVGIALFVILKFLKPRKGNDNDTNR